MIDWPFFCFNLILVPGYRRNPCEFFTFEGHFGLISQFLCLSCDCMQVVDSERQESFNDGSGGFSAIFPVIGDLQEPGAEQTVQGVSIASISCFCF